MRYLLAAAIFLGLALGLSSVFSAIGEEEARHRAAMHLLDEQRAAWEMAEQQRQALTTEPARDLGAVFISILPTLLGLVLITAAIMALWLLVAHYWQALRVVWPRGGVLPVPREQLAAVAPDALEAHHAAELARSQVPQPVPNTLHWHNQVAGGAQGEAKTAEKPTTALTAPPFARLLDSGMIAPGRGLILGYADGQPVMGNWRDLYSSAVAGLSGSGKTTTLRFLTAQSALQGARFVVLDKHADAGEESLAGTLAPLSGSFLLPPESRPQGMVDALEEVSQILAARLAGDAPAWPLIVVVEEFTALMGRSELAGELAPLIEAIAQEGRKVLVFALISGQVWNADRAGGRALVTSLASTYVHRMKADQARRLLPSADARRAEGLETGRALLGRTSGEVVEVAIPLTVQADMGRVAGMLPAVSATSQARNGAEMAAKRPETGETALDERAEKVREMVRRRVSQGAIIEELWKVSPGGGSKYKSATDELRAILAELLGGQSDART